MIPLSRYVDDFYSADRARCSKGAMDCFVRSALSCYKAYFNHEWFLRARLIRACLGRDSVEAAKCGEGNPLVILGVEVRLTVDGATFKPSADKVAKW